MKTLYDHILAVTNKQDVGYIDSLSNEELSSWSNYRIYRFLSISKKYQDVIYPLEQFITALDKKSFYISLIGLIPKSDYYMEVNKDIIYENYLIDLISIQFDCDYEYSKQIIFVLNKTKEGRETLKYLCNDNLTKSEIKKLKIKS